MFNIKSGAFKLHSFVSASKNLGEATLFSEFLAFINVVKITKFYKSAMFFSR